MNGIDDPRIQFLCQAYEQMVRSERACRHDQDIVQPLLFIPIRFERVLQASLRILEDERVLRCRCFRHSSLSLVDCSQIQDTNSNWRTRRKIESLQRTAPRATCVSYDLHQANP